MIYQSFYGKILEKVSEYRCPGGAGNTPGLGNRKGKFLMRPQSNRAPYFPSNLDDYAPWVATHGLVAPYGKCQCGCGQNAPIAERKDTRLGWLKGHPIRVRVGHSGGRRAPVDVRFWRKVRKTDTCWLWTGSKNTMGYGQLRVDGKAVLAHRLSWELHTGSPPGEMCVLHKCDTPLCVRPDHLFLGTLSDNMNDMTQKGRNPRAKLTEREVREIRRSFDSVKDLASRFGIAPVTVEHIKEYRLWRHVK